MSNGKRDATPLNSQVPKCQPNSIEHPISRKHGELSAPVCRGGGKRLCRPRWHWHRPQGKSESRDGQLNVQMQGADAEGAGATSGGSRPGMAALCCKRGLAQCSHQSTRSNSVLQMQRRGSMHECMGGTVLPLWISAMLLNQQVTLCYEQACFVHFSGRCARGV